ncbi:MAG: Ppx/GppA phosphatase family protein [Saccharospirillum sp.]
MLKLSDFWRHRDEEVAAIDLGSNSFHMVVARLEKGEIKILDRIKESVRLGFGLTEDGSLDDLSQRRALDCLTRFGQRIGHLPAQSVRAVGTRTLRKATNAAPFLMHAEQALGHHIDIISGAEEARLIYQGVAHGLDDQLDRRLVVDIGGGSTEVIVGEQFQPLQLESLGMGCVALTQRFFAKGELSKKQLKKASTFCLQKIEPIQDECLALAWQRAIGCSGSIKAVAKVAEARTGQAMITRALLDDLFEEAMAVKDLDDFKPDGVASDRQPVFLGGLIVLRAVFEGLGLERMEASPMALREGLLYDLIGRIDNQDVRSSAVQHLANRFHADAQQAQRVATTAQRFFDANALALPVSNDVPWRHYLGWAAQLAEVGLDISHNQYHRHSAYIVANSDLPGFSQEEQRRLTTLVGQHRKKANLDAFAVLSDDDQKALKLILALLRIAVTLHRSRTGSDADGAELTVTDRQLTLKAGTAWWQMHSLTQADLEQEQQHLEKLGLSLELANVPGDETADV